MIKNKAQTLLETVIVFVSLATILIGVMAVFKNFNNSMFGTLNTFKQTRLAAANSLVQGIGRGMKPLDYALFDTGSGGFIHVPNIPNTGGVEQEPRVLTAQLKISDTDNILNFVLPYKMSQVKLVSNNLTIFYNTYWSPVRYTSEIKSLCEEMLSLANTAYDNLFAASVGAVALLRDTYNNPTRFGPYYPIQCDAPNPGTCPADPRLPTISDTCGDLANEAECQVKFLDQYVYAFNMVQSSVNQNRAMLQQTISGIEQAESGLRFMLYEAPSSLEILQLSGVDHINGLKERLEYVRDNIAKIDVIWESEYYNIYIPIFLFHTRTIQIIDELVDFVGGSIVPCRFSNDFSNQITNVLNMLTLPATKGDVQNARAIVRNWSEVFFPGSASEFSLARNLCQEILNDIDIALDDWTDQSNRSFYISSAYTGVNALYRVTAINRRGLFP